MQRWTAALLTALLHALLVLLVMPPPPAITSPPSGGADGGGIDVTLIDRSLAPPPPEPQPPGRKPPARKKPRAPRPIARPPSTPVVPPAAATPPAPAYEPDDWTVPPAPAPRDSEEVDFPTQAWGQPPDARSDDAARANAALAAKLGRRGARTDTPAPVGPNIGVDGFHVYYELINETRLREWRARGMTELFLPLPGTRRLMVCPLEVALRRGSSPCRMVEMDSPELKSIGDAREAISIKRVYQLGDLLWSGPGPYR